MATEFDYVEDELAFDREEDYDNGIDFDPSHDVVENPTLVQDTVSISDVPDPFLLAIKGEETRRTLNDFYNYQEKQFWIANRDAPFTNSPITIFYIDLKTNELVAKVRDKRVRLTDKNNPNKFLSLNAIAQRGGVDFVERLGFNDYRYLKDSPNLRDKFYKSLKNDGWKVDEAASQKFKFTFYTGWSSTYIQVIAIQFRSKSIEIGYESIPRSFFPLDVIAKNFGKGGVNFVRQVLGVKDFGVKKNNDKYMDVEPREDIALDPVDDKPSEFDVSGEDEETSFDLPDVPEPESDIQNLPLQDKVNEFYESISKAYNIDRNAPLDYKAKFRIDPKTKQLKVMYKHKLHTLTAANNPKQFLALNTIAASYGKGGVAFVRDVLGVQDYGRGTKPKTISPKVETAAIDVSKSTPAVENIELQNLSDTLDQVSESLENLETEMQDAGVGTEIEQQDIGIETDLRLQQNLRDLEQSSSIHRHNERTSKSLCCKNISFC